MQVKHILNRLQKFKSFVYENVRFVEASDEALVIEAAIRPRAHSQPCCSGCARPGPGYDMLPPRRFAVVPLWGLPVCFVYAPRRVACPRCGVRVERLPWADGKPHLTRAYAWFLARWAKRVSWTAVAEAFPTRWDHVFRSVELAVAWGRAHMDLTGIRSIGVDEIPWQRGHQYLTLVYQSDTSCTRLLWVGEQRTVRTLLRFFRWVGTERSHGLHSIWRDTWKPYLRVIAKKASQALHVLDRFHIMAHLNKAIDEGRAQEARTLTAKGYEPVPTKTRWLLLKRPENLSEKPEVRLAELWHYNLRSVRSSLLKEDFQFFWSYTSPYWARQFLDTWCTRTMRSQLAPMKKVARMLRGHRDLLLNWFRAKGHLSSGSVEGFNTKAKLTTRKAFGFRTYHALEIALYHTLGALPEPEFTHRFC